MRTLLHILWSLGLGAATTASAAVVVNSFDSGFQNSGTIPDANTVGWQDTRTLTGIPYSEVTDIKVTLTISGGYDGDLYAYLTHDSGFAVLLNRAGKISGDPAGYGDTGFSITLDDHAIETVDIHNYQTVSYSVNGNGQLAGTWRPDGRTADPATVLDGSARVSSPLDSFSGLNPNGAWTLFIADLSSPSQSKVESWGLEITAVPEPVSSSWAMGLVSLGFLWWRRRRSIYNPASQ
jgi:MYXO-CTERM domain-containing protein